MKTRHDELAINLETIQARIAAAASRAGRSAAEVTLVAVTKTFPAADIRLLAELDVRDIGENRDQEAVAKVRACADLDLRWHFVGQLQTNKARSVARYASCVHSVDRLRLVAALSRAVQLGPARSRPVSCLVQVQLDTEYDPARGGARTEDVPAVAAAIAAAPGLRLGGLMTVTPLGRDPASTFAQLRELGSELRVDHPDAAWLSAGMTDDLDTAIAFGATHVRVGRALLGSRPRVR